MAETEVSNVVPKMVSVEEKCGLDMSCYQDLPKPDSNGTNHHNQANDLDNSYVFVNGNDGLPDGTVPDRCVAIGGSGVRPQPEGSHDEKLGEASEGAQHLNVMENGKVELSNGNTDPVNYSICKNVISLEDDGKATKVSVADSGVVNTCKIESPPKAEVKQVEVSDGIMESFAEAEEFQVSSADSQEVHTGDTENAPEANVKQVEDLNIKAESMTEAEVEKAVDQNGEFEGAAEAEQEIFYAVPPCPVENQECQSKDLGLVAEIGDNRDSDSIIPSINSSNSCNAGEDQIDKSVTEALEQQRSQDVVEDEDELDLQNGCAETEDEAKPTGEVAEAAEDEDSAQTSLGLDSESFPINHLDSSTLGEEAKTELSSDVLENQQGDSGVGNIVQNMVGQTDESKPVAISTDSHVQTMCGLVLEESNEDLSISAVENGVLYHEESQEQLVVCSTDSQVLATCDLVLEENWENLNESKFENGAEYHEELQEQLVVCSTDSQLIATRDLVLEENSENLSVYEVENGAEYHEESQELPVVSSTDSQVLSTCDLVLDKKNEDSSASEVEAGVQFLENSQEQPVSSTTDSQVIASHDSVFEGKSEDSYVSEVEDNIQCHEESKVLVVSSTDFHVQTIHNLKEEDSSVSEVESGAQYPEISQEQHVGCGASLDATPSGTYMVASLHTKSYPIPNVHAPQSETEVSDIEEIRKVSSTSVVGPESQTIEQVAPGHDTTMICTLDEARPGSICVLEVVVPEKEISFEGGEAHSETEGLGGKPEVGDASPEMLDVKLEPDGHGPDFSAVTSEDKDANVSVSCQTEVSDSCNANLESVVNLELEVDGDEDVGDQLEGAAGHGKENPLVQEKENTEDSQIEETSVSPAGVSTTSTNDGKDKIIKAKSKPFNLLVRTPRFDDENLREQITLARRKIDEKTKLRDAIQLQIQEKRASSQIHGIDYEYAKNEGRSARKLVRSKRTEIDSLLSVINKAKNASSVDDIDNQIHNMEHMIQHETLPLREEKQFIREIKQLKQLREQLSSNMGTKDEIKQALQQRGETEERLKILRKELDVLKCSVLKAEATAVEAGKKYDDENRKVKELQAQFRGANVVRQEAYTHWQNLRTELTKKRNYFYKYKDEAAVASNYAFSRDIEALYRLCTNQVESFMEMWNTNLEFRRDYIKCSTRSNLRRFGTLDCRSLRPDEEPPAVPSYADGRSNRMASTPAKVDHLAPQISSMEKNKITPMENVTLDSKSTMKVTEPKKQKATNVPAILVQVAEADTRTGSHHTDEMHEEPIKSRDEIELIREAEETRREEAEAKLKEQRRLEALAKANEARERKKRQAEKLQQRAELKTQKEAEQREKEREKRLRKKERKKGGGTDANDTNNNCETAASSESAAENSKEIDVKETANATGKKSQKPWLASKPSKAKSIPPPLRNRNKKKLQQWMWVCMTSIIIFVIFWMVNIGVFSNVALKRRVPFY